jgi:hypothetical protein
MQMTALQCKDGLPLSNRNLTKNLGGKVRVKETFFKEGSKIVGKFFFRFMKIPRGHKIFFKNVIFLPKKNQNVLSKCYFFHFEVGRQM